MCTPGNPNSASTRLDDPIIQRVFHDSFRWGYVWLTVSNLWSYRAADPDKLKEWLRRGGEWVTRTNADCMRWVERMARRADRVIVAWGDHGAIDNRGLAMLRRLEELHIEPYTLSLTDNGQPQHPLELPADLQPRPLVELRQEAAQSPITDEGVRHDV